MTSMGGSLTGAEVLDPLQGKTLVFIVGAPRSGTTWLQMLLTDLPEIASAFETHLFSGYMQSDFATWRSWAQRNHFMGLHSSISKEQYHAILRQSASSVLAAMTADKPGARIIIEKTPEHCACAEDILDLFPEAHFIHLVRDPRAVVSSIVAASDDWADYVRGISVAEACEWWMGLIEAAQNIRLLTPNHYELRYEDLLERGPQTLKDILDWLGIPADEQRCEEITQRYSFRNVQSERRNLPTGFRRLPGGFFRSGKSEQWKSDLSRGEVALIERIAGPVMERLGYKRGSHGVLVNIWAASIGVNANIRKGLKWRLERLTRRLWIRSVKGA